MAFGNFVVDGSIKILYIFSGPPADEFALRVFTPTHAYAGGDGFVFFNARPVSGNNRFQHGAVFEIRRYFINGNNVTV